MAHEGGVRRRARSGPRGLVGIAAGCALALVRALARALVRALGRALARASYRVGGLQRGRHLVHLVEVHDAELRRLLIN